VIACSYVRLLNTIYPHCRASRLAQIPLPERQGTRGNLPGANLTANATAGNSTAPAGSGTGANCTDPSLLINTMTTFCK